MKTKIKRHSRAVLSIVLTLCMLVSCMTVGIIATDAAKTAEERVGAVDGNEAVGAVDGNKAVGAVDGNKAVGAVDGNKAVGAVNGNKAVGAVYGNKAVGATTSVNFYVVNKCKDKYWNGDTDNTYFYQESLTTTYPGRELTDIGHYAFLGTYNMSDETYENAVFSRGSGSDDKSKTTDTTIHNTGSDAPNIYIINSSGSPRSVETKDAQYFLAGKINGDTNGGNNGWNRIDHPFTYSNGIWSINVTLKSGDKIKAALGYDDTYAKGPSNDWCVSHGSGNKDVDNGNYTISQDGYYTISFDDGEADGTALSVTPAAEDTTETVDIYAKNGTLRGNTYNRFTNLADTDFDTDYFEYTESLDSGVVTYTSIDDYNEKHSKKITYNNAKSGYNSDYAIMENVPIGAKIKIKTTLSDNNNKAGSFNSNAFKDTHYLKAYSFNGMSYQVNTPNDRGVYEEIWTVRDVNTKSADGSTNLTKDGKTIEVTPIYYMKDNTNCETFYIDGYDGTVQNAWGNMLCVYPYYEGKSDAANAFGGYPGQPMLFWGGKYQMEIPLTVDGTANGASVKGLTLHNGYWDLLHRTLDIRCKNRDNAQTYDYDDFYKLYKEKNPDTIIFDFKYRTTKDNFGDGCQYKKYDFADRTTGAASTYAGSDYNGVEIVTDYFGRQVDAFGTLIADDNKSHYGENNGSGGTIGQSNEILFVSTGYKDTYVGTYATIWAVYAPQTDMSGISLGANAGKFIGYISSSMLYLNNIERRLQYTNGGSTANGQMSWPNFVNTYNHLKSYYTGVPALISYEKEIRNDNNGVAYRSDGKWYYSNKSDQISSNIMIQYNSNEADSAAIVASKDRAVADTSKWTTDEFSSTAGVGGCNNIGTTTTCSAYFTNTSPNLVGKVDSGTQYADSTKNFTFRADANGDYMFVNWVRYSNGKYYEISENELAESVMSSNDTYIARFVKSSYGSLKISHVVEQNGTYKGTGTPTVTVTVSNGSDTQFTHSSSDGTPIDISSYVQTQYSAYTVNISLSTTPDEDCTLHDISTSAAAEYRPGALSSNAATVTQFTIGDIIKDNVSTLRYVSHLTKTVCRYNYEITYTYYSRFWGEQSYTQTGPCEDGDFTGSKTGAKLTTDFIIGKTPYEKNFRQQINWNYTNSDVASAGGTNDHGAAAMVNNAAGTAVAENTYKMTAHVYASNTVNDKVTAEFVLPYKYNEKAQRYTVKDTDVYNSSGTKSGTSYLYDSGNESVTLSTKAYNLFTYDDEYHTGSNDNKASGLPLMEAAPYLMTNLGDNDYHYKLTDNMRYYTGNSFKVGDTTYYLSQDDVPQNPGTYKVLTASDSVTFTKIKYAGTDSTTTYHFAVEDTSGGAKGEYGYKIYFFSYVADEFGNYLDNNGDSSETPVFNGQYCVYSVGREKDGIIAGKGSKKYFTRWDIYNTKGDFVTSCYSRRFSFSGYDNYVVKPIYESDNENHYASSSGLDSTTSASITYLGDTRNQWKGTNSQGQYQEITGKSGESDGGDKLIHDFALAYAYNGLEISKVPSSTPIKVGMIIEQLDILDSAGGTKITDSSYYADRYKDDAASALNTIQDALKSGQKPNVSGHTCINSKIGNNENNNWGAKFGSTPAAGSPTNIMSFDSVIDNFNRLQWFYTFTNTKTGEGGTIGDTNNANYAYRAWAYIIVGGTATVSSTPAYFTLYDSAHR